jgi:hypothetical protein
LLCTIVEGCAKTVNDWLCPAQRFAQVKADMPQSSYDVLALMGYSFYPKHEPAKGLAEMPKFGSTREVTYREETIAQYEY